MDLQMKAMQRKEGGFVSNKRMSAKDMAFEKERAKYRSEIRDLIRSNERLSSQVEGLEATVREKDTVIRQQQEWIERLLEYTELSKEDLNNVVKKDRLMAELADACGVFRRLGLMSGSF